MTLPPTSDLAALAEHVAALAHDTGAEANVLVTRVRHGLTRFANSFVHQNVTEDTTTVSLTVAVDGRLSTARTTVADGDDLGPFVARNVEAARRQPVDPYWPGATPATPDRVTWSDNADAATARAGPDDRAQGVRRFVDAAADLSAAGYLDTAATWAGFASTAGARASGHSTRATLDGIHRTSTSAGSAHQTSRRLGDLDATAVGALAADRARRGIDPVDLDPGDLEVVLGPEAVASLLVFLAVYGFNAKAHLDGASFAVPGEQQFDPGIHLREDPFDERSVGLSFDAEGTPRTAFDLIEAGVTRALAHDRRTAARVGTRSTGSAVPGGEAHGPIPTNLVLRPGPTPPDRMIESVERGLLVTQFHYCRALDPRSQVVTGLTRNGTFLVEDGQVTRAVADLRFTQSFVDALSGGNVVAVGDDDRYADSEFGPGMVVCPSLHLRRWHFTGGAHG